MEDIEETAESMDGFRGTAGRGSGRFGRDGGSMAVGEDGGEKPVEDEVGAEKFRIWACEDAFAGIFPPLSVVLGGNGEALMTSSELRPGSSVAKRASNFSRGERG